MKMLIQETDGVVIITFDGNIVQEYVSQFHLRLEDLITNGKINIVLNLKNASYMSSTCLAIIIDAKHKALSRGGDIVISCPNKPITNLLDITNLSRKILVFDSVEKAVGHLAGAMPSDGGASPSSNAVL